MAKPTLNQNGNYVAQWPSPSKVYPLHLIRDDKLFFRACFCLRCGIGWHSVAAVTSLNAQSPPKLEG